MDTHPDDSRGKVVYLSAPGGANLSEYLFPGRLRADRYGAGPQRLVKG